jgi:glutathione S-transferase
MSNLTLGYWPIRGLVNPIRLLLEHVGEKYDYKEWGMDWFEQKSKLGIDFANLPYLIDGNRKMAQSGAIIKYLARKHKLVAQSEDEMIQQDVVDGLLQDIRFGWSVMCYVSTKSLDEDKPKYRERVDPVLKELNDKLGKQKYVVGDNLNYNDFIFFEILDANQKMFPDLLKDFANLKAYHERIGNLKGVKEFMATKCPEKINGPMAKFGG